MLLSTFAGLNFQISKQTGFLLFVEKFFIPKDKWLNIFFSPKFHLFRIKTKVMDGQRVFFFFIFRFQLHVNKSVHLYVVVVYNLMLLTYLTSFYFSQDLFSFFIYQTVGMALKIVSFFWGGFK